MNITIKRGFFLNKNVMVIQACAFDTDARINYGVVKEI